MTNRDERSCAFAFPLFKSVFAGSHCSRLAHAGPPLYVAFFDPTASPQAASVRVVKQRKVAVCSPLVSLWSSKDTYKSISMKKVKEIRRPWILLCLGLGFFLATSRNGLVADAWSLSRHLSNRAVAEKRRKFHLEAQSSLTPSSKDRRRWWRFGRKYESKVPSRKDTPVRQMRSEPGQSKWDNVKRAVYGTADAFSSLSSRILGKDARNDILSDGYGSLESNVFLAPTRLDSPAQRLMKEYQRRSLPVATTTKEEVTPKKVFDGIKDGLYSAAAGVGAILENSKGANKKTVDAISRDFKPVTKTTVSRSTEVREALPKLKSSNPVTKWQAEQKIKGWEVQQQKRQGQEVNVIETIKASVYQVSDAAQAFVDALLQFPIKVAEAAEATRDAAVATIAWFANLPGAIENLSKSIAGIPQQVNKKATEVQTSVEDSVKTTQNFVQDVQAFPTKVQTSVKETQEWVDDRIYDVKVIAGLEERKPHPPTTPPPEPATLDGLAWDLTGAVAKESAKAALWAGTEFAKLSWKGAQLAFTAAVEHAKEQMEGSKTVELPKDEIVVTGAKWQGIQPETAQPVTTTWTTRDTFAALNGDKPKNKKKKSKPSPAFEASLADVEATLNGKIAEKDELDIEVSEALKLAQKAMDMAGERPGNKNGKTELDKALERAKEAAIVATQEAVEIEKTLNHMP